LKNLCVKYRYSCLVSCAVILVVVSPGLGRLDFEPLVYDDGGLSLEGSQRARRDVEGSGLYQDYGTEVDDEDQDYYSSAEILPSREPGIVLVFTTRIVIWSCLTFFWRFALVLPFTSIFSLFFSPPRWEGSVFFYTDR
jgi:hypothetical protein